MQIEAAQTAKLLALSKKEEAFRYLPMQAFEQATFSKAAEGDLTALVAKYRLLAYEKACLVFVNGCYDPALSNIEALSKSFSFLPFEKALKIYGSFLKTRHETSVFSEKDLFASEAREKGQKAVLYIAPNSKVAFQTLHIVTGGKNYEALQIFLGKEALATWYQTVVMAQGSLLQTSSDCSLDNNAHLQQIVSSEKTEGSYLFTSVRATLQEAALFKSLNSTTGGLCVRHRFHMQLLGQRANATLQGIAMLAGKNQSHTHVLIEHLAKETTSEQLFKNVLKQNARSSFEGKIYIEKEAALSQAYQLNNNLLLEEGPIAYSKPNLEIFESDVKASHGATFQQLEEDALFYLQARGISRDAAAALLLKGFCQELLLQIEDKELKGQLMQKVEAYGQTL